MPILDQATVSMDRRPLLIRQALNARRAEVREIVKCHLRNAASPAFQRVANVVGESRTPIVLPEPGKWWKSSLGLDDFLLTAASDGPFDLSIATPAEAMAPAHMSKRTAAHAMETLKVRYCCPLNIVGPAEDSFFEEALRYLMVVDRVEHVDDLCDQFRWILLNLLALRCRVAPDIRGLDVLNFFWERLPRPWPQTMLAWSLLGCYDAALAVFGESLFPLKQDSLSMH